MKTELVLVSLLALAGVALFMQGESIESTASAFNDFQNWQVEHGINITAEEQPFRLAVWLKNLQFVKEHNAEAAANGESLRLKMTPFAHMELEEYIAAKLTTIQKTDRSEFMTSTLEYDADAKLPSQVNWVSAGAVTPVQNQGSCGSCWAFSTVAGLEGLNFNETGKLIKLSEQQVLSCVPAPFSLGCRGGNTIFAYTYTSIAGVESESAYPYTDVAAKVASPCEYNKKDVVFQNKGVKIVPENNPKAFQAALAQQVVSVSVDAANIYFQLYSGGVMTTSKCGTNLDHAITAVGYDMDAKEPYWNVKNSWGTGWGEKGYIQIAVTEGPGVCGINMDNTYPTA